MLCERGCGKQAIYFSKNKNQWVCDKVPSKCSIVAEKIGSTRRKIFEEDPSKHNAWGRVLSEETKRRIGEKNAIALKGRKLPEHVKKKLSEANTGRLCTDKTKEKIRQSNLEHWAENERVPWNKGKKGLQVAWNKGKKKQESLEIISRDDPVYSNFRKYRNRVAVRTRKVYEQFKDEINPQNLLLGKCGIEGAYQIDHKISVRMGFEQGISIEEISSKENLQIIPWLDNVKKYDGKGNRK
jgi:hypothetical protein